MVERDRVGHADGAAGRYEGGLQHVRVLDVLALHAEVNLRRELEGAAALRVEKAREDRLGVEARERQPVDRAVAGDERGRPSVPDQGVVANRRVPVDPLHRATKAVACDAVWGVSGLCPGARFIQAACCRLRLIRFTAANYRCPK